MRAARSFVVVGAITATVIVLIASRGQSAAPLPPGWRTQFDTAMARIPFGSERAPIFFPGTQKEVYPPGARSLRIAAPLKRDSGAAGRVIARISTATGYPRLGIAAGANYLWQEVDSAGVRFLVIPANPRAPMKWLTVGSHTHEWPTRMARLVIMEDSIDGKPGTPLPPPPSPTMVASAYICTNDCSSSSVQWCTAKDTLKFHATLTQLTSGLAGSIAGYFARNQVAWPPR